MIRGGAPFALWALAAGCWWWLFAGARSRAALLRTLAARYGGFVRVRFSLATLTREPRELAFVHMAGRVPVRFRFRFEYPLGGGARPGTIVEFELPAASLGDAGGDFFPGDLAAGRGLFLGGENLTAVYTRFVAALPRAARPELRWQGSRARLFVPALLGEKDELWAEHCLAFMRELAGAVASLR